METTMKLAGYRGATVKLRIFQLRIVKVWDLYRRGLWVSGI